MIKPCDIRDIHKIEPTVTKMFGFNSTVWIREKIYSKLDYFFYFDEDLTLYIQAIGNHKFSIHTLGSTKRMREYKNFAISAGGWMFDNTACTSLIAYTSVDNKRMQRFISLSGGKRVGIIPDADGVGKDEIMYVLPIRDRLYSEGRGEKVCR